MENKEWSGDTFGTSFMHKWLISALRHTDVRIWYAFTAIFIVPWCMFFSEAAKTTYEYFRLRHGLGNLKALWKTYVTLCLFAQVVIDRFALYAGKKMKLKVDGIDLFKRLSARQEGFVILSAHIGCYEMSGYELSSDGKPFNVLVYAGEKAAVMSGRSRLFAEHNIRMIPVTPDMSHLYKIEQALAGGEIVSIPGDRVFGSGRTVSVSLLGGVAELPYGPFSVPAMRGLDVLAINVMKTSVKGYTVYFTPLQYDKDAPRKVQVQQLAEAYAAELERMLRLYPTQWFNFFEFWKQ